jgi:hypothetical protein
LLQKNCSDRYMKIGTPRGLRNDIDLSREPKPVQKIVPGGRTLVNLRHAGSGEKQDGKQRVGNW